MGKFILFALVVGAFGSQAYARDFTCKLHHAHMTEDREFTEFSYSVNIAINEQKFVNLVPSLNKTASLSLSASETHLYLDLEVYRNENVKEVGLVSDVRLRAIDLLLSSRVAVGNPEMQTSLHLQHGQGHDDFNGNFMVLCDR